MIQDMYRGETSDFVLYTPTSATFRAAAALRAVAATNPDTKPINLGLGDVRVGGPPSELHNCLSGLFDPGNGMCGYTPALGHPQMMSDIAASLSAGRYHRLGALTADNLAVTCGGKHAYSLALQLSRFLDTKLVATAPGWCTTIEADLAVMGRLSSFVVQTTIDENFFFTPNTIQRSYDQNGRVFVLIWPCVPAGTIPPRDQLEACFNKLLELAKQDPRVVVIIDDPYQDLILKPDAECPHWTEFESAQELFESGLLLEAYSYSKRFRLAGVRLGYLLGHKKRMEGAKAILATLFGNPPTPLTKIVHTIETSVSQATADGLMGVVRTNADLIVRTMTTRCGLGVAARPEGGIYVLADVSNLIGQTGPSGELMSSDQDVARELLTDQLVGTICGLDCNTDGTRGHFLRLATAMPHEEVQEGVNRIAAFVANCGH